MCIVIVTDSYAPKVDGVALLAARMARHFAEGGRQVVVIAPAPGPSEEGLFRVVRLPSIGLPFYRESRLTWPTGAVARTLAQVRPDVVLVLTTGSLGYQAARACPQSVPLIHIYTTDVPRYLRAYRLPFLIPAATRMLRAISERAENTLCPTDFARNAVARLGVERLGIWGRGVDSTHFHPRRRSHAMRARLTNGEPERPLALYVGRLAREKRLDDLAEAVHALTDHRFAFIGDGPMRRALEHKLRGRCVHFTGYLHGTELATAMASTDVFVFPSDSETFGQVVLQAMASGIPPIVASNSAPAELAPHDVAGIHVPPRDGAALAQAIRRLCQHTTTRRRLGVNARARAERASWPALLAALDTWIAAPQPQSVVQA